MKRLTFFLPFRNEERSLGATVECVSEVATRAELDAFEILLIDDGSTDGSPSVARGLEERGVAKVITLPGHLGFGAAYLAGLRNAKFDHAMFLSADGDVTGDELRSILEVWNGRQPLVQYCTNEASRLPSRFFLSKAYTKLVGTLSGTKLPYYNGFNILPVKHAKTIRLDDFGFCTQAQALLKLLRTCEEEPQLVGTVCRYNDETSQALTPKNFKHAARFLFALARGAV